MSQQPGRLPIVPKAFVSKALIVCAALTFFAQAAVPQLQTPRPQQQQQQQIPPGLPSAAPPIDNSDPFRASMEARRLKMQNDDRHKRLVADTEKLLTLSTELKEDVSKTTKNELSLDVIKKAAEIERLARDVKERMRS